MDLTQGIIVLAVLLAVAGAGFYGYVRVKRKVRDISRQAFGTDDIMEGFKKAELEASVTPKSIAAVTSLYLPKIMQDFPDFHYDEMKARAETMLTSYLRAVEERKASLLTEGTSELRESLELRIQMLENQLETEHFHNIKIHRTEIAQYRKTKGRCSVVFQSAVEYIHFVERDGELVRGKKDMKEQSRYNMELLYIQDRDTVENMDDKGLAMTCPSCGAPLPKLGAKKCAYCDCPIVEFSIRTWNFCKVAEK